MKSTQKILLAAVTMAVALIFLLNGSVSAQTKKPWVIPDKYKSMKSTSKPGDATAIANGKEMWAKHCKACHGSKGLGDGPKAASLKTSPGDFSTAAFQGQPDGAIYYESFVGRDEMPNFEKKITAENERWDIVAFIRSLKK
jgi:mono/diheme cytochrome c family protein